MYSGLKLPFQVTSVRHVIAIWRHHYLIWIVIWWPKTTGFQWIWTSNKHCLLEIKVVYYAQCCIALTLCVDNTQFWVKWELNCCQPKHGKLKSTCASDFAHASNCISYGEEGGKCMCSQIHGSLSANLDVKQALSSWNKGRILCSIAYCINGTCWQHAVSMKMRTQQNGFKYQ